ncbi:unnamed protein product [Aphanomyces euteiches]|uniref:START domain-containing protein n=1 Tax=Aphanomyces euteiches TaxID=100861 RepID=A0A6G0X7Z1_9STRA|nr:hypothetical protein Ae201684_007218 [Aphanomyces euteiches]KAH9100843.1 hypothetical protein Ae201684P_007035 [Aphanomyces euteiches]
MTESHLAFCWKERAALMSLPLPPDYFVRPALSQDEIKTYRHVALKNANTVVQRAQVNGGTIPWTLRSVEGNMRFYKAPDPLNRRGAYMFMSVIDVAGSVDEVIDLFETETTEKAKAYVKRFNKGLLDAVKLYSIAKPPEEQVDIIWFAMKSPIELLVSNRDCVMLECRREFQSNGARAWVRALRSIEIDCCPDMYSTLGLVRSIQYGVGHIVVESLERPGRVEISFLNHFDIRGNPPEWLIEFAMKKRCKSVVDIDVYLREDRLARGRLLHPAECIPLDKRRCCFLCQKPFSRWSSARVNCLKCGEVLCRYCVTTWHIKLRDTGRHQRATIQACWRCTRPSSPPKERRPRISSTGSGSTSVWLTNPPASSMWWRRSQSQSFVCTRSSEDFVALTAQWTTTPQAFREMQERAAAGLSQRSCDLPPASPPPRPIYLE